MDSSGPYGDFYSRFTQVTIHFSAANHPGTVIICLRLGKNWWTSSTKFYGERGELNMGSTCGSRCTMSLVTVEAVGVLPKTEPGHSLIWRPQTFLWWWSTGHQHRSKVFYRYGNGKWLLESSGGGGGTRKTVILHPRWKSTVESDAYGGPKFSSNISRNDDEAKHGMGHSS